MNELWLIMNELWLSVAALVVSSLVLISVVQQYRSWKKRDKLLDKLRESCDAQKKANDRLEEYLNRLRRPL